MHSDVHLRLHHARGAELRERADHWRLARACRRQRPPALWHAVGRRLGWSLVETGLRLIDRSSPHRHSTRQRYANFQRI